MKRMLALSCYPERQEINTETKAVDEVAKRPEGVSKQPSVDFSEADQAAARCPCLGPSADSRGGKDS